MVRIHSPKNKIVISFVGIPVLVDLKYHLTSLIAVFLALAVGIMVGSSFMAGSSMERQITKGLEKEFGKLRAENMKQQSSIQSMQTILERHNKFEAAIIPMLVEKRLVPYKVAIIQTGDYNGATQKVKAAIEMSGGHVINITTLSDLYGENTADNLSDIVASITGNGTDPRPVDRILQMIANCIISGSNPKTMEALASKGIVNIEGDYTEKGLRLVLVGGSKRANDSRADDIDLALIDKLKTTGAYSITGTEPLNVVTSYMSAYQSQGIATVDNIDEPMGQAALVFAIDGDTGNFGVKKSADRVSPTYLEESHWRNGYRR
ncbi:MAG: copper transporter [Armatimonadota bacterium]